MTNLQLEKNKIKIVIVKYNYKWYNHIIDESTNHLDIETRNYIDILTREQIEDSILSYKPTIIFVEHDERFIDKIATKKIYINGRNVK